MPLVHNTPEPEPRQIPTPAPSVEPGALRRVTTEEMDEEMKEVMEWARRIELSAGELGTT